MRFAEVAVDAPVGRDRTFSYSIPASLEVGVGQLVRVPFGPRTVQGLVTSLTPRPAVPDTREIISAVPTAPALTGVQMLLARWTSDYYMSTLFEAAALMLPPGGRVRQKSYFSLRPGAVGERPELTQYQERVLAYIGRRKRVEEGRLVKALGQGARAAAGRLVASGVVLRSQGWAGASVGRKYVERARLAPIATRDLDNLSPRATRQRALVERLLGSGADVSLSSARREYGASAVRSLLERGWLVKERVAVDRDPLAGRDFPSAPKVALTAAQNRAVAEVRAALDDPTASPRAFLLEGVTGSGKTEVYLDAVDHCLQLGKRAIVLVPEIALAPQTVERFAARFRGSVGVLHSGLSAGERLDQWWNTWRGEYGVVIGSRGAVFAPQPDLGLIVVDEEHEWTYKQHDAVPRYHARAVALRLADLSGSVVLLGSATPDVGSYHRASSGRIRLLRLPERVAPNGASEEPGQRSGALASVEVVDMRRELREGNRLVFSRSLLSAMADCLRTGSQAILFLNRRGSASFMQCRSCGFGLRCRRCDVALTYHKDPVRLLCHYCGDRRRPPERCPQCLGYSMSYYGVGTQAVVEEVSRRFPEASVLRWDRDATRRAGEYEALLERFRSGEAQVMVGTQMIAKGLHFPSVTLVGVVLADVGLGVPDYRAGERAFQLLCQVSGRSGRGSSGGKVIIQTYRPDSYAIRAAATQDYPRFYREELAYRREQGNPPFGRLLRLLYTHTNGALCEREGLRLSESLRRERDAWGYSDVEVLGPTPAYPARLRGRYRWQLVLRGSRPRTLLDRVAVPQGWAVDVDPVGLG